MTAPNLNPDADRLFNCCTGLAAPDWSAFSALRLGGCKTVRQYGDDVTEGCVTLAEAEFLTVYGIGADGMAEAITDTDGADLATGRALLAELAALSGLPSHECGYLEAPTPGQLAYEAEVAAWPDHQDGKPRRAWSALPDWIKATWERNPTPRDRPPFASRPAVSADA